MVALASRVMSKRGKVRRNDTTVKIDVKIADSARKVASLKGQALAEYLSDLIRPLVARDLKIEAKKLNKGDDSE